MRDKIIALAMCGLLAITLFACGEKRGTSNDSDILGDEQHHSSSTNTGGNNATSGTGSNSSTHDTTNGNTNSSSNSSTNGSDNSSTGSNAKKSDVMGNSAMRGNTLNPANGSADRTATWEQMLENGRVHDRDGFLFDGENSHWS